MYPIQVYCARFCGREVDRAEMQLLLPSSKELNLDTLQSLHVVQRQLALQRPPCTMLYHVACVHCVCCPAVDRNLAMTARQQLQVSSMPRVHQPKQQRYLCIVVTSRICTPNLNCSSLTHAASKRPSSRCRTTSRFWVLKEGRCESCSLRRASFWQGCTYAWDLEVCSP